MLKQESVWPLIGLNNHLLSNIMKKITLLDLAVQIFDKISRDVLYSRIMCGELLVDGEKNLNPSCKIYLNSKLTFVPAAYVSRGGLKLDAALKKWNIDVSGKIFLDAGSSTGGFTDCLLKKGASKLIAVDVGYNQLAYTLRKDSRVFVHEKCNIMSLLNLDPVPHSAVADLSFRSISGAGRHIIDLTSEKWMIALIKPQFEIDPLNYPGFKGIISGKSILKNVLQEVLAKLDRDMLLVEKVMLSPIKGRKGNTEFLFLIRDNQNRDADSLWIENITSELEILVDGMP